MRDTLLRGLFQVGGQPDPAEECVLNWRKLGEFEWEFNAPEDKRLFAYFDQALRWDAVVDISQVRQYFEEMDDIEVVTRINEVAKARVFIRTNYEHECRGEHDRQQQKKFILACRDAAAICEHGRHDGP